MTFTTTTIEQNNIVLTGNTDTVNAVRPVSIFAPFNYLTNLKLVVDVEMAIAGQNNHIANAIRLSIKEEPAVVTLAMIKDMADDNITMMQDMLGLNLVKRISNGI